MRLEKPVFAFAGDRFLLRDASEQNTLAGGIILDPDASRSHARDPERLERLHACAAQPELPDPFVDATVHRRPLVPADALLVRSRFSTRQIHDAIERQIAGQRWVRVGTQLAAAAFWSARIARAAGTIDQHHQAHPDQAGLPLVDLRSILTRDDGNAEGFDELVAALTRQGFTLQGTTIRRATHRPELPPHLRAADQRLRDLFSQHPLDPPGRRELAPDEPSRQALRYLIQNADAVELGPEIVLGRDAFALVKRRIIAHLRRHGRATASELRQELGMHRRVLIPLLERLDRDGITTRDGDTRTLRTVR